MTPFSLRGPWEDDVRRRPKIDKLLPGKDTRPFSEPGERSRGIETGNLQEIAVRTLWDHSWGPKPENMAQNQKHVGFGWLLGRTYYLLIINLLFAGGINRMDLMTLSS